jgi:hypothetical protein
MNRVRQASGSGILASAAGGGAAVASELEASQFSGYPLNARQFGARGDGTTDDTAALQKAIDTAFGQGINLYIPAGIYRTTAALIVSLPDSKGVRSGWRMFGAGPGQYGGAGGTEIRYTGNPKSTLAVLQISGSAWRTCNIEEMTLLCDKAGGAQYGICFKGTEFSQHTVRRVVVMNAGVAVGVIGPSGANGEFTLFDDCYFGQVDGWYYTNASQAFVPLFRHCRGSVNFGGIYFNLDLHGIGAGGLEVFDCNATSILQNGISNSVLFRNGGSDSVGIFMGGRIEHLTQLYINEGGTPNLGMPLKISGMEIGIDFDPTNRQLSPEIAAVISTRGNTDAAVIESCRFFGDNRAVTFPIKWDSWSDLRFHGCIFEFWSGPPYIVSSLYNERASLTFNDCRVATISPERLYRPNAFDRHMDIDQVTIGKRRVYSENAWVASGRPENLLVRPQVTTARGGAVVPDAPWKMAGAGSTIAASDWGSPIGRPKSSSPFAKNIVIPKGASLYQDISGLNLSSSGNYGYDGAYTTLVSYQALVTYLGVGAGRIAIVDSVSEQVYDQYVFARGGPQRATQLITLSAVIERKKTPSFPRLVISSTGAEPLTYEFAWQMVSGLPNPTFADSSERARSYSGEWGAVVENFLAFSRVALPHKPDDFGATAPFPLSDLASDIYLSATDEKLTYFANGRWWKTPRSMTGTAPPVGDIWAKGDKIENTAPEELGERGTRYIVIGWICVAAGSPGSWLSMRVLTGN